MLLAHSLGAGGPEIEFLILSGACLALGVFFFFQKNVKPQASVVLLIVAIALGVGAFAFNSSSDAGSSPVKVSVTSPADGATVPANEVLQLDVDIQGGELSQDATSTDPTMGHLHVFVDGELTSMPSVATPEIEPNFMKPGEHEITVEFTRSDHRSFSPRVLTKITVTAE